MALSLKNYVVILTAIFSELAIPSSMPSGLLGVCSNPLVQNYTTTTHGSSSLTGITVKYFFNTNCAGPFSNAAYPYLTNSINLNVSSKSFSYCGSADSKTISQTACLNSQKSLRVISWVTDTTTSSDLGSCVNVTCSGLNFSRWVVSEATVPNL